MADVGVPQAQNPSQIKKDGEYAVWRNRLMSFHMPSGILSLGQPKKQYCVMPAVKTLFRRCSGEIGR